MTRLVLALSLALVPVAASAAPAVKDTTKARTSEPASAPARVYDFDADDVTGESLLPEGVNIGSRPQVSQESLIKVRTHFIPQMLKMAIDV